MTQSTQGLDRAEDTTPDPDDPRKPDDPTDLHKRTWFYVARKVWREFGDDQCTDLAAALTYYGVLALFPAAIALSAVLGLVGQSPEKSVQTVLDVLRRWSPRTPSARSRARCSSWPAPRAPAWPSCWVCSARCGRRRGTSAPSGAR